MSTTSSATAGSLEPPYRHLDVERRDDVWSARLRQTQLDEPSVHELGNELLTLVDTEGCRKLVLILGPDELVCLYSVLLSKLVTLQKHLNAVGGGLKLAEVGPATLSIFEACRLSALFDFAPDRASAIAGFSNQ